MGLPCAGDTWEHLIAGAAFEAVWQRDLDSEELSWIGRDDEVFGYQLSEVGDRGWWKERVHPDDLERVEHAAEQALRSAASSWDSEYRFRRKDGSWACVLSRGAIERDERARGIRAVAAMIDISAARKNEEEVHGTQRLLRQVIDTLPVGVIVVDRTGRVLIGNPASSSIWGRDVIASGPERWARSKGYWHGSGEPIGVGEWASQRALANGETSLGEVIDIEAFDGQEKILENAAAPIRDAQGTVVGAVVVNQDVTEAKQAAEEVARRARQQEAVAQISLCALRGDEMERLFDQAARLVSSTLEVEYGFVAEWLPDKEEMAVRATAGPWKKEVVQRIAVRTVPGLMAWFYLRSELPVVVADLAQETRFAPCELLLEHGVKSGIAVPIGGKDRPFGVLEGNTTRLRRFASDEVNFVWSVANVLATSIEQRRAASELERKREQLRSLSGKLIAAQEAERRAVARELHDDFGQILTAIKLNLMRKERDPADSISLVDGAIARMRDLAHDLRPPMLDELGLPASLRWYLEREARRAGLDYHFADTAPEVRPSPGVEATCFRVAQEALTNVIRHAKARRVEVELRVAGSALELTVRDDGGGFDVAEALRRATRGGSQGLIGMQERVALAEGDLQIDSRPGHGTAVRARFPLGGAS